MLKLVFPSFGTWSLSVTTICFHLGSTFNLFSRQTLFSTSRADSVRPPHTRKEKEEGNQPAHYQSLEWILVLPKWLRGTRLEAGNRTCGNSKIIFFCGKTKPLKKIGTPKVQNENIKCGVAFVTLIDNIYVKRRSGIAIKGLWFDSRYNHVLFFFF